MTFYKIGGYEMKAYLIKDKQNAKCYYCQLKWKENNKWKTKEISTGIPKKGNNLHKAEKKKEEIRREYEKKIEGHKITPFHEMTFDEYMLEWLSTQKQFLKPSTLYGYQKVIEKHIIPFFKPLKINISELTPQYIQAYYNKKLEEGLSAKTVKRHHANIRKALQDALMQNVISYNMADRTRIPAAKKYQAKIYNQDQMLKLLDVSKGTPLESVIMLCSHYALRRGEVCGLCWSDIDFTNKIIHIRHTRTTSDKEIFQDSTKTQSSTRDLPISDNMYSYLSKLKMEQNSNRLFLGDAYYDTDFVCVWEDGKPLAVNYISHAFADLIKKNNLPHIRFHDIRHSVATNLLENNIDLKIIQEYLGHSTMATTANFYLHPNIEQKEKAVNVMSNLLYHN